MSKHKIILNTSDFVPGLQANCTLKESAAHCTRCNACAQSCPAYLCHLQENFSPRGRAQLIRSITEKRLNLTADNSLLKEITNSCILCGRCTAACAGQIPVGHYMLSLQKAMHRKMLPLGLRGLLILYRSFPKLFSWIVQSGLFLHWLRIDFLLYPLLPNWMKHAQTILPHQLGSLQKLLRKQNIDSTPTKPKAIFLPSIYSQYIDPQAGLLALQSISAKNPVVLWNADSGLFDYLYGSRVKCIQKAKKLLLAWEGYSKKRALPLMTDSIEAYGFLKNYPLLFEDLSGWKERAEKFAAHVQFITDIPFPAKKKNLSRKAALDSSSLLFPATLPAERARKILLTTYGKNLLECEYSRFPLPAASVGFAYPNEASDLVLRQVKDLAREQIERVYCLSAWAALELNAVLRKRTPHAQACFIIYIRTDYERA